MLAENPDLDTEGLFWALYLEVVKQGSEMFLPLFEASGHKEGFLSGQCDPRAAFDGEAHAEAGSRDPRHQPQRDGQGAGHRRRATTSSSSSRREGIATNNTLTFVLSQLMDCAKSVMRGLEKAKANGVDLSNWRSVITHMEARYGDLGGLRDAGKEVGVELSEGDVRLAELAIFKKAYRTINERGYQSKMLSCSLRVGPTVDGKLHLWHLEEKAGASVVVTCPPPFIDECINFPDPENLKFEPHRIDVDPPKEVMDKLLKVPYFARAYDEDGYTRDEYNTHPALVKTAAAFNKATQEMVDFAASCLAPAGA